LRKEADEIRAYVEKLTRYGGLRERVRRGCNGYRGTEIVPECEGCEGQDLALEELGIRKTDRRDFGTVRVIRWDKSFEDVMRKAGCYGCEKNEVNITTLDENKFRR